MKNSQDRGLAQRIKSPLALPTEAPVNPGTSAPSPEQTNSPGSVSGSALRFRPRRCAAVIGGSASDPTVCSRLWGHFPATPHRWLYADDCAFTAPQPGTPVEEAPRPERPICGAAHQLVCDREPGHHRDVHMAGDLAWEAEEAPRPERPICGAVSYGGKVCTLPPHGATMHNPPGSSGWNYCARCGAAPGAACDPAKHDARADFPRVSGRATAVAEAMGIIAERVDPALTAWQHHTALCGKCQTAPSSAGLCLAGAALATAAGLKVPDGATVAQVLQSAAPPDPEHPRHMRTSELMRRVAGLVFNTPDEFAFSAAEELRARADRLDALPIHAQPFVRQIDGVTT